MAAIDRLKNARLLLLDISYQQSLSGVPPWVSLPPNPPNLSGVIFRKDPGTLDFTFDARQLQIPALQSELDIKMNAAWNDADHVRWEPSLPGGSTYVTIQGTKGILIDGVSGAVTCNLTELSDPLIGLGSPSDSSEYAYYVQLATAGANNSLTAKASYSIWQDIALTLSDLAIMGRAGEPVELAVSIRRSPWSGCFEPWQALMGDVAEFWADTTAIPGGTSVGYQWGYSPDTGPVVQGSLIADHLRLQMPNDPQAVVTVTLTVTVTGADGVPHTLNAAPFNVFVLDPQLAERMEFFCKIFMEIPEATVARFVDPLRDPIRDLVTRPADQKAAREVATFLRRLSIALEDVESAVRLLKIEDDLN